MNKYLTSIILISVAVGLIEALSPTYHGLEKYVRTIGIFLILIMTVAPGIELLSSLDENFLGSLRDDILDGAGEESDKYYEDMLGKYLNGYSKREYAEETERLLGEKFGIPADECEVILSTESEDGSLVIKNIKILLSGASVFKNPYEIENYFSDMTGCKVEVLIKYGGGGD